MGSHCPFLAFALATLAFCMAMCLSHTTFAGILAYKLSGTSFLWLHNPKSLTPCWKNENQVSAIAGGIFPATGGLGFPVFSLLCCTLPTCAAFDGLLVYTRVAVVVAVNVLYSRCGIKMNAPYLQTFASRSRARNRQLPARKAIRGAQCKQKSKEQNTGRRGKAGLTIEKC